MRVWRLGWVTIQVRHVIMHSVVQNQSSQAEHAGRPPQFDRQAVIADARTVFWRSGYEGTTLAALEEATGVDRSSIYNSFGGKSGLYEAAVLSYIAQGEAELFRPLTHGTAGVADIDDFLGRLRAVQLDDSTPAGCLIINDLSHPANDVTTDRYLALLQTGVAAAIERSNEIDHTDPTLNEARRVSLVSSVVGVNLLHHRDATAFTMIDGLRDLVKSWLPG